MSQPALQMPADERSDAILSSIRAVLLTKGFDGASMQDLARAAGMSVGNFYRYFPSKSAIIAALVARDLAAIERDFAQIITCDHPMQRLRDTIADRLTRKACAEDGPLWAEISAAALRKPDIAAIVQGMEAEVTRYLLAVFAHVTGLPQAEAARRFGAHAAVIVVTVKSSAMLAATAVPQAELLALVQRNIDHMLNEITLDDPKG